MLINSYRFAAASGGTLWTPTQITTALWLDAADAATITSSGGLVSQWDDKSGNARHATQSTSGARPIYGATQFNSLPGVTFDGTDDRMTHGCSQSSAAYTLIAVYKVNSSQVSYRGVMAVGPSGTGGLTMLTRVSTSFIGSFGSAEIVSTFAYQNGQSVIAVIEDDNGTATKSFWANGSQAGTFTDNPVGQAPPHIGGLISQPSAITIAECLAISSVASATVRQLVEGYLAHKWALQGGLPAGHPYKSAAPTV